MKILQQFIKGGTIPVIETSNLTKIYEKIVAVDNLNLSVKKGINYGLIGPNGAGKTTTIRMILGLCKKTNGRVKIFEKNVEEVKNLVGYVPETYSLYDYLSGKEFLHLLCELREIPTSIVEEKIGYYVKLFELGTTINNLIYTYSKGTKQKLLIISSIIHDPHLLILDEPFNGLDPISSKKFKDFLGEYVRNGGAVFLSTHILEIAEKICDEVGIIQNGKLIFSGNFKSVMKEDKKYTLEELFVELVNNEE